MVRPDLNATAEARVKGLVGLRDCVQELIDLQMDAAVPDSAITQDKQAELNRLYDSFSAKYGLINDRANRLAYADDSSYYLLCALEVIDEDGKLERKADMFTKRTIKPHQGGGLLWIRQVKHWRYQSRKKPVSIWRYMSRA